MQLLISRRITVVLIGLALSLGPMAHGVQAAAMAGKMIGATASVMAPTSDMSGPADCDACAGGDASMSAAACAAMCATPLAILLAPLPAVEPAAAKANPIAVAPGLSLTSSPDLSPPRPAILS